jgi:putative heme-binding domain-containing protein
LVAGFCDASGEHLDPANDRAKTLLDDAISDLVGARAKERAKWTRELRDSAPPRQMRDTARAAIALLAFASWERVREPLTEFSLRNDEPEVAQAALRALASFGHPEAATPLLTRERWAVATPAHREAVLGVLLTRSVFFPAILDAVERGDLPASALSTPRRAALLQSKDTALRTRAERLLTAAPAGRQAALDSVKAALDLAAHPEHGREVFRILCASCHRLDREGHAVGPDLFDIRNQPKENILFHIVAPDAEIAPAFTAYVAETRDGRALAGLLASESPTSITLRMPLAQEESLPRSHITTLTALPNSMMPAGLETAMTPQDLADLLAYLKGE